MMAADGSAEPIAGLAEAACRSCGARIVLATATMASTTCAYCRSPVVLIGQLSREWEPDTLVPFTIGADQARAIFEAWLAKKRYIKAGFYSQQRIDRLVGMYYPYFVVDAQATVQAEGTAHYSTGGDDSEDYYYHVFREGEAQIQNLPQEALRANRADKLINRLLPWDLTRQVPFAPQYLTGFQAERRDLSFEDVATQAAYHVDLAGRRVMATDIVNANRTFQDVRLWGASQIKQWRYRYTLLPAWVLFYTAPTGELYYFGINGQTGETAGELPVDRSKLLRDAVLLSAGGALISILGVLGVLAPFSWGM
jgi:hypothetical protein